MNSRQIIPVFTLLWDDNRKSNREKIGEGSMTRPAFLLVLVLLQNLARVHDEATTSDNGGDIGNQFNIVTGADDHGQKANDHQEACYQEGACRDSGRTADPGAARADAEPAVPDRRSQTGERR